AEVDFLTIGQYLQPTKKHHPVVRFVPPDEFAAYHDAALAKGFLLVSASPLTRSSYHAGEDFALLKARRTALRAHVSAHKARIDLARRHSFAVTASKQYDFLSYDPPCAAWRGQDVRPGGGR